MFPIPFPIPVPQGQAQAFGETFNLSILAMVAALVLLTVAKGGWDAHRDGRRIRYYLLAFFVLPALNWGISLITPAADLSRPTQYIGASPLAAARLLVGVGTFLMNASLALVTAFLAGWFVRSLLDLPKNEENKDSRQDAGGIDGVGKARARRDNLRR